jgi:hypothetical protein
MEDNDDMAYATPGHAEDHDFMTAFFSNQDHDAFSDDNAGTDGETYLEEHFNDFLQQAQKNDFAEEDVPKFTEEDEIERKFLNGDQPVFQFFGSEDGDLITENFNEFPEDDLFADMQDSGDPECEEWKKKMNESQAKLKKEGRVLQAVVNDTEKEVEVYEADQAKDCSMNCSTVCIPSDAGETCVETKNGTCVAREPKIEDCARKMPDPDCKAKEAECKGKKRPEADKMSDQEKKQDKSESEFKKVENEMLDVTKGIPEKCKTLRF